MTGEPDPTPPNPDDGIDLEELVGKVLDSRGITTDRMSKLDSLDALPSSIGELFKEHASASATGGTSFDEEGFTKKLGEMIDGKLSAIPGGKPEKKPALLSWLGLA